MAMERVQDSKMTPYEALQERETGYADAVDDILGIWRRTDNGNNLIDLSELVEAWLQRHEGL